MRYRIPAALAALVFLGLPASIWAQGQRGSAPAPPQTPKAAARVDMTGYWVSYVTEDWQWRMITPKKGDFASLPLNAEGRRVGNLWDPAKDEAAGDRCKAYGPPFLMRIPGRLHITWENDNTLRVDTDAGTQTRLFRFGEPAPAGQPTLQGQSVAEWIPAGGRGGYLQVVTTNMRPGYLRKNGPPYSGNAKVTEFFDKVPGPNGVDWLILQTIIEDPQYLTQPMVISTHYRKEPDAKGWNPTACEAR